jgi:putative ABC transport system permease protein
MPDRDEDLAREIRAHLELEAEERVADGASPEEARAAAMRAFGNVTRVREESRYVWISSWSDQLRQDLRYAGRLLARTPGFAVVAMLTLALGIGANTAVFSVVHAVLLRPLPFADSDRIVRIVEHPAPSDGSSGPPRQVPALKFGDVATFRSQVKTLSHVGVHIPTIRTLTDRAEPVRLIGARVSPDLLTMIGATPVAGRLFHPSEDTPGADAVVILSTASWVMYFGGRPTVVGEQVELDGRRHTIVGVLGAGAAFPDPRDEFWMPLATAGPMLQQGLPLTGRLADGVSAETAAAEISALIPRIRGTGEKSYVQLRPLLDLVVAPIKPALLILMVAVGLILLIACANIANLLLARAASRQRESAVRLALGAGPRRLIRQALTESLLLAGAGGAAGVGVAFAGIRLLRSLAVSLPRRDLGPGIGFPRLDEITIDGWVLGFTVAVSIATGLLFGLIPAIRQSQPHSWEALRQGPVAAVSGFSLFRRRGSLGVLVVAEIAMATVLLVGGGLMIHSFVRLTNVNPGFDPSGVVTFQISLPPERSDHDLRTLTRQVIDRLRGRPDVRAIGYAEALPMTRVSMRFVQLGTTPPKGWPQGLPVPGSLPPEIPDTRLVSRDFMKAMGIPLISGRAFGDDDRAGAPQVLLINRTLARSGLLGTNPVGTRVYAQGPNPWEVVGIVDDVRQIGIAERVDPQIFIDDRQVPPDEPITGVGLYVAIRTDADPEGFMPAIRPIVTQLDSRAIVENIAPMNDLVSNSVRRPRLYTVLLGIFAGIAVALAAIGIYGVMAYAVTQRTREIAVRMALGANPRQVLAHVLGQSVALTAMGILLGLGGAAALARYLDQMLFGLSALDPATFAAVALLFFAIALVAAFVPARRATRIEPVTGLRLD